MKMSFIVTQPLCLVLVRGAQGLLWKLQFANTDPASIEEAEAVRKKRHCRKPKRWVWVDSGCLCVGGSQGEAGRFALGACSTLLTEA